MTSRCRKNDTAGVYRRQIMLISTTWPQFSSSCCKAHVTSSQCFLFIICFDTCTQQSYHRFWHQELDLKLGLIQRNCTSAFKHNAALISCAFFHFYSVFNFYQVVNAATMNYRPPARICSPNLTKVFLLQQ